MTIIMTQLFIIGNSEFFLWYVMLRMSHANLVFRILHLVIKCDIQNEP